jgi:type IV pilus assembly protein PilB
VSDRLGELLREKQRITQSQFEEALAFREANGGDLGNALVQLGVLPAEEIAALRGAQYGVRSIDLSGFEIERAVLDLIPAPTARRHRIVPLRRTGATLTVAMTDPRNVAVLDDVRFRTGCTVEPLVASEAAVGAAIARYYDVGAGESEAGGDGARFGATASGVEESGGGPDDFRSGQPAREIEIVAGDEPRGQAPAVRLVNAILTLAVQRDASDVHVEPYEKKLRIRCRIDGVLHQVMTPPLRMRDAITSRLKVMASLDIAERRVPQDGRIRIRFRDGNSTKAIDLRVSSLPTLFGEKIVLRLLDQAHLMLDMTKLGFEEASLRRYTENILKPWGMVLVTGPTGSGKTNTLYSSIARLNTADTNIVTAEDPVEFNLEGVNQVQIRDAIGLSFAKVLRALLRQDPNVILVGEIRDVETAEIAVKAALTGHLVLSTLHTNDAPSAVGRLLNMGIEPFLIAGSVNLICAQRLVRRVCRACAEPLTAGAVSLVEIGFGEDEARGVTPLKGNGCDACNGTGYKGRIGLYEVLEVTDPLRDRILAGGTGRGLRGAAIEEGMLTLRRSGLCKIAQGVTSVDEVTRETVR